MPLTIGRGSGCVIVLSDTAVSRMHCTLRIEKDGVHFEDQASRNATLVNGVPKSSGLINPGDRLTVGESIFTLSMSSEKISRDPGTKGSSSTIHILAENVPYLEASSKSVSEGNPQTVSDLYWLFTSTRRLSASHVREHFIATLVDIMQDRFSADGILIRGLRSPQQSINNLHFVGDVLPMNDVPPHEYLSTVVEETGGRRVLFEVDEKMVCSLVASLPIGPETIGAVMVQKSGDSETYSDQDLEVLVALCRSVGPLYQSVCAVEKMMIQHEHVLRDSSRVAPMIGRSDRMEAVRHSMNAANRTHMPVLIEGETGTGKEIVAIHLHAQSERQGEVFVTVNCAAIPSELFESEMFGHDKGAFTGAEAAHKGRFEIADGGILFLDEVATLSLTNQAKLLRVLESNTFNRVGSNEDHEVDVRVISASNIPLETAIANGGFRDDLYHRLCGIEINVPPLRERKSDIVMLAEHFMTEACFAMDEIPKTFSTESLEKLEGWDWPGNVRELRMCVERAVAYSQSTSITPEEIIFHVPNDLPELPESLADLERQHIIKMLEDNGGNISTTAKQLGISRTTLYNKLDEYGVRS
ncbi:sigma 54-dependent Fis family transcriptional regulator [bacterium AH-315-P07]|nr:sigma 54-dependent Fis family transcriptional regulator [bacterium AH-315-P07]